MMASPKRILVVDDDRAMVRSMCDVLRISGWEPEPAFSGEAALRRIEEQSFGAVLMDVKMDGMSGVDALQAIRVVRPALPVILMTAYSTAAQLRDAELGGVRRVLQKPVSIPLLLQLLGSFAEARRAVLVVDDDPDYLRTIEVLLVEQGYTVRTSRTLDHALEALRTVPLAVVLLDLRLGERTPAEVVETVGRAAGNAAVIAFSGHPDLLDAPFITAPNAPIAGRLRKPFSPDQLTRLLDDILG